MTDKEKHTVKKMIKLILYVFIHISFSNHLLHSIFISIISFLDFIYRISAEDIRTYLLPKVIVSHVIFSLDILGFKDLKERAQNHHRQPSSSSCTEESMYFALSHIK